jgi:hypothetical protein
MTDKQPAVSDAFTKGRVFIAIRRGENTWLAADSLSHEDECTGYASEEEAVNGVLARLRADPEGLVDLYGNRVEEQSFITVRVTGRFIARDARACSVQEVLS